MRSHKNKSYRSNRLMIICKIKILLEIIIFFSLIFGCQKENPKFDKLIFKSTDCFGGCPEYYLEINQDKTFKLFAEKIYRRNISNGSYEIDSAKMGYFKGEINKINFEKLNKQLELISKSGYKYDMDQYITDTPTYTLVVRRAGDKICYETFYPTEDFYNNTINLLLNICDGEKKQGKAFSLEYKYGCR